MKKVISSLMCVLMLLCVTVAQAYAGTYWDDIISGLSSLVKAGLGWVAVALNYVLAGFIYTVLSGIFSIITALVSAIELSTMVTTAVGNVLPTQLVYLINTLGLPQGLSMITYAIIIRLGLNLIPAEFTRA